MTRRTEETRRPREIDCCARVMAGMRIGLK